MKHSGFTPGPWMAKSYDKYGTYQIESAPRSLIVAAQIGGIGKAYAANVALIADAPRLAEENERLRAILIRYLRLDGTPDDLANVNDLARRALAVTP